MFLVKRHNIEEQEKDNKRLNGDIIHILGLIAQNLIYELPTPYTLTEKQIESNGVSRPKTLRLLREVEILRFRTQIKGQYGSYTTAWNFENLFMEHSKEYAKLAIFPDEPLEITGFLTTTEVREDSSFRIHEDTLETVGYKEVSCLPREEVIHVFWNLQDYDIKTGLRGIDKNSVKIYPKTLLVQRNKAVLKALLKKYSETDFKSYMEKRFGDNYDGQTELTFHEKCELNEDPDEAIVQDKTDFDIILRNFAKYPQTLGDPLRCFLPRRGYMAEYKRKSEAATFEYNRLKRLVDKVNTAGGCKAVAKDYIQECCKEIVGKAPLLIDGDDGDKTALEYILDHRDVFTYDYIYA